MIMMTAQSFPDGLPHDDFVTMDATDRKHAMAATTDSGGGGSDYVSAFGTRHSQLPYTLTGAPSTSMSPHHDHHTLSHQDDLSFAMPHFLPPQNPPPLQHQVHAHAQAQARFSEQELADSLNWQAFAQGAADDMTGAPDNSHLQLSQEMLNSISSHPSIGGANNSMRGMFIGGGASGAHDPHPQQHHHHQQHQQQQRQQQQQQQRSPMDAPSQSGNGIPIAGRAWTRPTSWQRWVNLPYVAA